MGTKNSKGSVSIETVDGRLRLRWRFQGHRYSLSLFHYSKDNLKRARQTAVQIQYDLSQGQFDHTLSRYRIGCETTPPLSNSDLVPHFEFWVKNFRNMDCSRDIDYFSTRNMMKKWETTDSRAILNKFNAESISPATYNRRLTLLKKFFEWAKKAKILVENPLEDVLQRKTRKSEKLSRKPFKEEEISRILTAIKDNTFCSPNSRYKHSHYYEFVYFIFKTGVRNAEAVGLRVGNVDLKGNSIHIREALARTLKGGNPSSRIRKDTKNGKHRVLPLTPDLRELLAPLVNERQPDELVFRSFKGLSIDDDKFQKRIFRKILIGLKIDHRVLYACRHTFGSRCIEQGISPVTTAFLMGNGPQTALKAYTHLLSLPTDLPPI